MLFEVLENEGIDSVTLPLRHFGRRSGGNGGNEGPVLLVFRSFLDPLIEQILFFCSQRGMRFRRGHDLLRVVRADAVMKFALLDLSRNNGIILQGILTDVEAQFGLPSLFVGAVTSIAFACQKRSDFTVEINATQAALEEKKKGE